MLWKYFSVFVRASLKHRQTKQPPGRNYFVKMNIFRTEVGKFFSNTFVLIWVSIFETKSNSEITLLLKLNSYVIYNTYVYIMVLHIILMVWKKKRTTLSPFFIYDIDMIWAYNRLSHLNLHSKYFIHWFLLIIFYLIMDELFWIFSPLFSAN